MLLLNGIEVGGESYPNGEGIYRSVSLDNPATISIRFEDERDITKLMFVCQYLQEHGITEIYLNVPYFPYSRMDRKIFGYMFTLQYFADFLNSVGFEKIIVFDPHSSIVADLVKNVEITYPQEFVADTIADIWKVNHVFYPDKGASTKYSHRLSLDVPHFAGEKVRDLETGKILSYVLVDVPKVIGDVLVVDDLCVYGGTFLWAAKLLKEAGAGKVYLYVSHCENSIHDGELLEGDLIEKVYTTDSILTNWDHSRLVQVGEFFK